MRAEDQADSDASLRQVLLEWRIHKPLPTGFHEQVWTRIVDVKRRVSSELWRQFVDMVVAMLSRRSLAFAYVSVLVSIGILAGYWQGRTDSARKSETLGARYVQMLDPYRASRH